MEREKLGLPPAPFKSVFEKRVDDIVKLVQDQDWANFGYFLYRTSFGDDARYDQWFKEFDKIYEKSIEESVGGATIMDRLFIAAINEDHNKDISLTKLIE